MATFVVLYMLGSTINTMILGGLALAFSRVIDNSVISLENIYRHLEMGSSPAVAAEQGGAEVNLAVLAATLVDVVDFFPVTFLFGVSKFLFSALAARVLPFAAGFVRGGDDRDSAVLLEVSEGHACRARRARGTYEEDGSTPGEHILGRPLQCLVQSPLQQAARSLRARGAPRAEDAPA